MNSLSLQIVTNKSISHLIVIVTKDLFFIWFGC